MRNENRHEDCRFENHFGRRPFAHRWLFLLLIAAASNAQADTLKVGSRFPMVDFLRVRTTSDTTLASLPDVQETKAIVFVFASW